MRLKLEMIIKKLKIQSKRKWAATGIAYVFIALDLPCSAQLNRSLAMAKYMSDSPMRQNLRKLNKVYIVADSMVAQ